MHVKIKFTKKMGDYQYFFYYNLVTILVPKPISNKKIYNLVLVQNSN